MRQIVLADPREGRLELREVDRPARNPDEVLVQTVFAGIDATDEEVISGEHGAPPAGDGALTLGHECLGRVVEAPENSGFEPGDLVVPLVRHGCGGCDACAKDAVDLCPNEDYVEHGIQGLDGFMRDYWTDTPDGLVKAPRDLGVLNVLAEPLSIVEKAYETATFIQQRIPWFTREGGFEGRRALLAGTGSLGSLAAFLLRHEGMDVWAMDRSSDDAYPARLLAKIGVHHVNARERDIQDVADEVGGFDLVIEATGVPKVLFRTLLTLAPNGILCTLGVPPEKEPQSVEADDVMRRMVMHNQVMFGSVNSNRHHFELALDHLRRFRQRWGEDTVGGIITHRYAPDDYEAAFRDDDPDLVKKIMEWHPEVL